MKKEILEISNKKCTSYYAENSEYLIIQPIDDNDLSVLDSQVALISQRVSSPFTLVGFMISDWNAELSPWEAPPVFGKVGFGCGAERTLSYIERELIPHLIELYGFDENIPVILGGYSLAGFFSLWSSYKTDRFSAIMAASPSVWFPNWIDYAQNNVPRTKRIYLSLGDKEEKAKNKVMATVGDSIREQYDLLCKCGIDCVLEWNEGNHFKDTGLRCANGFIWCLTNQ